MRTPTSWAAICLVALLILSQDRLFAGSRAELRNDVSLELAGKCLLYSFSYQRMVAEPFGVEVGVSLLGGGSTESSSTLLFFTGGGRFYLIPKDAAPYIGGGFVVLTASSDAGPFSSNNSSSYGFVGPGFEYRSEGGFLLRGSVYVLIANGGFFVWPGLSVGVAF